MPAQPFPADLEGVAERREAVGVLGRPQREREVVGVDVARLEVGQALARQRLAEHGDVGGGAVVRDQRVGAGAELVQTGQGVGGWHGVLGVPGADGVGADVPALVGQGEEPGVGGRLGGPGGVGAGPHGPDLEDPLDDERRRLAGADHGLDVDDDGTSGPAGFV